MKKQLCLLIMCVPLLTMAPSFVSAQDNNDKGIKWTTGLSWEQIKQKAKKENKYIFVDAYTTWCGPCKMMDSFVYSNDTVGDFFNQYFIAVKVQMDKTKKDDQKVKDWYDDATALQKEFFVNAYPSFIFLSPDANIVQKEGGYKPVQQFVALGKDVLTPGKSYDDPYKKYKAFVNEYKQGIKRYDQMPFMINAALEFGESELARDLFKEFVEYSSRLNETERYTQENIKVWSRYTLKLDSKALGFFLQDGDKIDKVMNQKGYSCANVDKAIQARIVDSFFRMQKGDAYFFGNKISNSEIMFMRLPVRMDGKIEPDLVEADWEMLESMIREHFNKDYTIRNLLMAKARWYRQHQNFASASKSYFTQLDKYPPTDLERESGSINEYAWETFLYVNDKKLLNKALVWLGKVNQNRPEANYLDTYANLLYKLGRTQEAIAWEEKALALVKTYEVNSWTVEHISNFQLALEQMKKGEPTKLKKGAIWLKGK